MNYRVIPTNAANLLARGASALGGGRVWLLGIATFYVLYTWGNTNALKSNIARTDAEQAKQKAEGQARATDALRTHYKEAAKAQPQIDADRIGINVDTSSVMDVVMPSSVVDRLRWARPPIRADTD